MIKSDIFADEYTNINRLNDMVYRKLFFSVFFGLVISLGLVSAQTKYSYTIVFSASSNLKRPITIKTSNGQYTITGNNEIRINRNLSWFEAYDGNGDKIMPPGQSKDWEYSSRSQSSTTVIYYNFTTLYPKSSSSYSSSSSSLSLSNRSHSYHKNHPEQIASYSGNYNGGAAYSNKAEYIEWKMPKPDAPQTITNPEQYCGKWIYPIVQTKRPDMWEFEISYGGNEFSFRFREGNTRLLRRENANNWLFMAVKGDDKGYQKYEGDCNSDADPGFPTTGVYYYNLEQNFFYYRITLKDGKVFFHPLMVASDYYYRGDLTYSDTFLGATRPTQMNRYLTYAEKQANNTNRQAVDLGLSVLWANINIGAKKEDDAGDYFSWGGTAPQSEYWWTKTKYWLEGIRDDEFYRIYFSKYITNPRYGKVDDRVQLELSDDAARLNWGEQWRMPTWEECAELIEECTWVYTETERIPGYKVTGPNGNSIFLPFTGGKRNEKLYAYGDCGFFWTSSLADKESTCGKYLSIRKDNIDGYINDRYIGYTIRPVMDK